MFKFYLVNQINLIKKYVLRLVKDNCKNNPFKKSKIIIQDNKIEDWLKIEFSENFGIFSNILFLSPESFFFKIVYKFSNKYSKKNFFDLNTITWHIMKLISDLILNNSSDFKIIKNYLYEEKNDLKLYHLSRRIAIIFLKYIKYCPNWISLWEKDKFIFYIEDRLHEKWQKTLWVSLFKYSKKNIFKYSFKNIYSSLIRNKKFLVYLSSKKMSSNYIFIFNSLSIVPMYLEIIKLFSNCAKIHFFYLTFSKSIIEGIEKKFFFNINKRYEKLLIEKDLILNFSKKNFLENFSHKEEKEKIYINQLLFFFGKISLYSTFYLINFFKKFKKVYLFNKCGSKTLLSYLKNDLSNFICKNELRMNNFSIKNCSFLQKRILKKNDKSVTFHLCETKRSEIEVLKDYIISHFKRKTKLVHQDILVMSPNINEYVPYIKSVFGYLYKENKFYSIPGESFKNFYSIFNGFLMVLDLPNIDFTTKDIFSFLEIQEFISKIKININDIEVIKKYINKLTIRRGFSCLLDEFLKNKYDDDNSNYYGIDQNTWLFGFNKAFLGRTMFSNNELWNKIFPYDKFKESSYKLLEKIFNFINLLFKWKKILSKKRKLLEWIGIYKEIIFDFFCLDDDLIAEKLTQIEKEWKNIIKNGLNSCYRNVVSISLIKEELVNRFEKKMNNQNFFDGKIVFSDINSTQFISYKVICLIGMNDFNYPYFHSCLDFDLFNKHSFYSDYFNKERDRYIFLEILNSANKFIYFSYVNFDIKTQKKCYPSILIIELINYIALNFYFEKKNSKLNFEKNKEIIKSYLFINHNRSLLDIKRSFFIWSDFKKKFYKSFSFLKKNYRKKSLFISKNLNKKDYYLNKISLKDLIFFYKNPIKAFFLKRLNVSLKEDIDTLKEEESFNIDRFCSFDINKFLLDKLILGSSLNQIKDQLKNIGLFPVGNFLEIYIKKKLDILYPLSITIKDYKKNVFVFSKSFKQKFEKFYFFGDLKEIYENGIFRFYPTKISIYHIFSLWIEHLTFCLKFNFGISNCIGTHEIQWRFLGVSKNEAKLYLSILLDGFRKGMCFPLLFFPKFFWNLLISFSYKEIFNFLDNKNLFFLRSKKKIIQFIESSNSFEINNFYYKRVFSKIKNDYLVDNIQNNIITYLFPMMRFIKKVN